MDSNSNDSEPNRAPYTESVRISLWMIGLLGLVLGVTAGVLTGVAVRNIAGDEPLISGSNAAVFYASFLLAIAADLFLLLNFTNLSIRVNRDAFSFRYGMFRKNFTWDQVRGVEARDYKWITYGGWGIRFSTGGRRAWSQLGAKRGVVVNVIEGGNQRAYFVSSHKADELAEAISNFVSPIEDQDVESDS